MKKDIVIFIGSLNRGGAETHLLQILPSLIKTDLKITLFLLEEKGELFEVFKSNGVSIISPWIERGKDKFIWKPFLITINAFQAFIYLLFFRPQIAHFFLPKSYLIGGILSVLTGVPIRIMSRRSMNNYLKKYPNFIKKTEFWLHSKMTRIFGNSKAVVNQLIQDEGVDRKKVHLIYNGIKLPTQSKSILKEIPNIQNDSIVFVITANLIPYKGHRDLIEAFAQLSTDKVWDLLVVGNDSGHIQAELETLCVAKGIQQHIHFLGKRTDVANLLHVAHVGVLASHEEGFSNAILEYMAAGLAVIATDVGGNAEAVKEGENGFIVPPHAPDVMGKAIDKLMTNTHLIKEFGVSSQKRHQTLFTLEKCVKCYYDSYKNLLIENSRV